MPFVHAARFYPAAGKAGEMRPMMEEFAKDLQAVGVDARLSACAYGPEGPYFHLGSRWATLADREQMLPTIAPLNAKHGPPLGALSRQPGVTTLLESLQVTNQGGSPKWLVDIAGAPALGKGGELQTLLVEFGEQLEAQGQRTALFVQLAGPESGRFVRVFAFDSLADVEAWRAARPQDSDYTRRRDALMSRPWETSIREVLVPFAS